MPSWLLNLIDPQGWAQRAALEISTRIVEVFLVITLILALWALYHRRLKAAVELIVLLVLMGACVWHPGFYVDLVGSVINVFTGH